MSLWLVVCFLTQFLAYRLVALVKSLLGKGGKTDFQVRQWGIRRTWKSVVPLKQQAVMRRVTIAWHERAREFMGETPIPRSNTPYHSPLKQRAVTIRVSMDLVPMLRPR